MTRTIVATFLQLARQDHDRAWVEADKFKSTWARLLLMNALVPYAGALSIEAINARIALVRTAATIVRDEVRAGSFSTGRFAHARDRAGAFLAAFTAPSPQPESTCPVR